MQPHAGWSQAPLGGPERGGRGWPNGKKQDGKKRKFYFQSKNLLQTVSDFKNAQGQREPPASSDGDAVRHGRAAGPGRRSQARGRASGSRTEGRGPRRPRGVRSRRTSTDPATRLPLCRRGEDMAVGAPEGAGCQGPAGRAQGAPQMQGTGLRSCLPPSGASQLGLRAGAPCCAGHREATPGLACPPRARDSSGPGQSWCRVSWEGAQSHEPHPSQVPRPPEPQFPPCKTGHLQVQVREEARDRRGKLVTHREPQGGPSRAPVPGTRVAGAAVASLAF